MPIPYPAASAANPEGVWGLGNGTRKPMIGKVAIIEGIRPGVITFTLGHGMWATGASDVVIDGMRFKGPENGSVSFYDTKVKLVAV